MATINGIVANEKSMSGVVESPIGDVIECTTLIADSIDTQNIYAKDGLVDCSLFNNDYATVTIGNSATNLMNLGSFQFLIDTIRHITSALNIYLFPTTTGVINFATSASQILFGSSTTLVSSKVPTANNHLTNKQYVDSVVGANLIPLNNTWTGINTFSNPSNTPSFKIDNTGGVVELDFLTNPSNLTQKTGKIIASATGGVNSTALSYYGNDHTFYGELYQLISNLYTVRFGIYTGATSLALKFNTNSASFGTTTNTITASGGTNPNTGTLTLSGISSFNNNSNTQSVKINPLSSGTASVEFYTNTSNSTQRSSAIIGSGGTTADGGELSINANNLTMNTNLLKVCSTGTYVVLDQSNMTATLTATTTLNPTNVIQGFTYIIPYSQATTFTITFTGGTSNGRSGNFWYIFNNSNLSITLSSSNIRMVGSLVPRAGNTTFTMTPNSQVLVRNIQPVSAPFNNSSANDNAFIISSI